MCSIESPIIHTTVATDAPSPKMDFISPFNPSAAPINMAVENNMAVPEETGSSGFGVRDAVSIGVGVVPVAGSVQSVVELISGKDYITGEETSRAWAAAGIIAGIIPGGKGALKAVQTGRRARQIVSPNSKQSENIKRFTKKIPSNSRDNMELRELPNGSVAVQATSPGKVPGSKAVYEKQIDVNGKTLQATKTTYDPKGNIIHVKDKINGGTYP